MFTQSMFSIGEAAGIAMVEIQLAPGSDPLTAPVSIAVSTSATAGTATSGLTSL